MNTSRRTFAIQSFSGATALCAWAVGGTAQAQALVADNDPQAIALGYKSDATQTDTKKYPNYASGQSCSACVLFQGKAADPSGSCAVFGSKMVAGKGWCSAWAKKG